MPVRKNYLLKALAALGTLNLLWLIYFICTTDHAYLIATIPEPYFNIVLLYFPVFITIASIGAFLFDLLRYKEKNWFAFFAAFIAVATDAVFAIGSLYFLH